MASTIYSLTLNLPELVPVRHGHPRPPAGPRPRRGAAASQIRPQSTGTRSGDLRPSEAYALPIQGYHLDLSTGACGAVLRSCCSNLFTLSYGTVAFLRLSLTLHAMREEQSIRNISTSVRKSHRLCLGAIERVTTDFRLRLKI